MWASLDFDVPGCTIGRGWGNTRFRPWPRDLEGSAQPKKIKIKFTQARNCFDNTFGTVNSEWPLCSILKRIAISRRVPSVDPIHNLNSLPSNHIRELLPNRGATTISIPLYLPPIPPIPLRRLLHKQSTPTPRCRHTPRLPLLACPSTLVVTTTTTIKYYSHPTTT